MQHVLSPAAREFLNKWTPELLAGQTATFPPAINTHFPWLSDFGLRPELPTDSYPMAGVEFAKQYRRALSSMTHLKRTDKVNKSFNSYGLKHDLESLPEAYISNGAVILAALRLGFDVFSTPESGPNAYFNAEYEGAF